MLPIVPILGVVLPAAVKLAEGLFSSSKDGVKQGSAKKEFVMGILAQAYDRLGLANVFPNFETVDERQLFLDLCSVAVDHFVLKMKAQDGPAQ